MGMYKAILAMNSPKRRKPSRMGNMLPPLIFWAAVILHGEWGLTLINRGEPLHTTGIDALYEWFPTPFLAGAALLICTVLAVWSLIRDKRDGLSLGLLLPQQFLLIQSAGGSVHAIVTSQYADKVIRPMDFILADQLLAIILTVMHTFALGLLFTGVLRGWKGGKEATNDASVE